MAVNNSWILAPWADALYASDVSWWQTGQGNDFKGLKISRGDHPGVKKVNLQPARDGRKWNDRIILQPRGVIGAGGSSGFQALNLMVQFGAKRIAMIGIDCTIKNGTHWHGDHASGLANPRDTTALLWRQLFDEAAPDLKAAGISVTNCSPVSTLRAYPKLGFGEWLEEGQR